MANRSNSLDEQHEHNFGSYNRCSCGVTRLSRADYSRHCEVYNAYYDRCAQTSRAKLFWLTYEAFKGDMAAFNDLNAQSKVQRESEPYLPKPDFDDPRNHLWKNSLDGEWFLRQGEQVI